MKSKTKAQKAKIQQTRKANKASRRKNRKAKKAQTAESKKMSALLRKARKRYTVTTYAVKTKAGGTRHIRSCDNNDSVARKLRDLSLDQIYSLCAEVCGCTKSELVARYSHLNPGQQRMNCGNKIRGASNRKAKGHDLAKAA